MPQIVTGIGSFGSAIDQDELATTIQYGIVPIGMPLPFLKNLSGTPSLPSGWVELNGQTISDAESVYDGVSLPDWNGSNLFIRGNATSGTTGGNSSHSHTVTPDNLEVNMEQQVGGVDDIWQGNGPGATNSVSNLPPYANAVWCMRIK